MQACFGRRWRSGVNPRQGRDIIKQAFEAGPVSPSHAIRQPRERDEAQSVKEPSNAPRRDQSERAVLFWQSSVPNGFFFDFASKANQKR